MVKTKELRELSRIKRRFDGKRERKSRGVSRSPLLGPVAEREDSQHAVEDDAEDDHHHDAKLMSPLVVVHDVVEEDRATHHGDDVDGDVPRGHGRAPSRVVPCEGQSLVELVVALVHERNAEDSREDAKPPDPAREGQSEEDRRPEYLPGHVLGSAVGHGHDSQDDSTDSGHGDEGIPPGVREEALVHRGRVLDEVCHCEQGQRQEDERHYRERVHDVLPRLGRHSAIRQGNHPPDISRCRARLLKSHSSRSP